MTGQKATELTIKLMDELSETTASFIVRMASREKEPFRALDKVVKIILGEAETFAYDRSIQTCAERFREEILRRNKYEDEEN